MDAMVGANTPELVKQALDAQDEYAVAITAERGDQQRAILAVIHYGEALLVGRELHPAMQRFRAWVSENELDHGKPWSSRVERTAAMAIARIVRENGLAPNPFEGCPRSRPNDIAAWYRKQHPKPKTEAQLARDAGRAAKAAQQQELALVDENQQLAEATWSAKSKMTITKAIGIYKKRLDKSFYNAVSERVRAEIASADNHVRKLYDELRPKYATLEARFADLQRSRGVFTRAEFRQLLMCCHPDASAGPEIRAKLTNLLVRNENRLLKEE